MDAMPTFRLKLLSLVARALGIQFHFEGVPYGGRARPIETEDCD